jgi:hypothetical protein
VTRIYLAWEGNCHKTLSRHKDQAPVDLLVAFPALPAFLAKRDAYNVGHWCLDSGAFGVWNSGKVINVDDFTAAALDCDADEVFGLDVIGDALATRRNLERSWELGLKAIPTFHGAETVDDLEWCLDTAPEGKIAVGGAARRGFGARKKLLNSIMAVTHERRTKVHGFGMCDIKLLEAFPFHSVDATSWKIAPSMLGQWAGYTGKTTYLGTRNPEDYWVEVVEYQRRARAAAHRWASTLAMYETEATV